jgi:hypothetical protein
MRREVMRLLEREPMRELVTRHGQHCPFDNWIRQVTFRLEFLDHGVAQNLIGFKRGRHGSRLARVEKRSRFEAESADETRTTGTKLADGG